MRSGRLLCGVGVVCGLLAAVTGQLIPEGLPTSVAGHRTVDFTRGTAEQQQKQHGRDKGKCPVTPDDPDGDCLIGQARYDYPELLQIPETSFSCDNQEFPGMYADVEANCQVFHVCPPTSPQLKSTDPRYRINAFLCPPGLRFNQLYRICDWWFNVKCEEAPAHYAENRFYYKRYESPPPHSLVSREAPASLLAAAFRR